MFVFTSMAGGRRSGRERKALASADPLGAAVARVPSVGSHPREPESATKVVPAVRVSRNLRRVIPAPSLPFLDRSPKLASCPRLSPEKVIVVLGEVMLLSVGPEYVVEVVRVSGVQRGLDRLAARAADGSWR